MGSMSKLSSLTRSFCLFLLLTTGMHTAIAQASEFDMQFTTNYSSYGLEFGIGQTADIPACSNCPPPRKSHRFFSLLVNYERNLTGLTAEQTAWPGAWFWRMEGGVAVIDDDGAEISNLHLVNFSPLMVQYRVYTPKRNWSPKFLGGVGFALTNWRDFGGQPLNSEAQFLVHLGAGIEISGNDRSYSIDYRLLHVSNGGSDDPNIGINAHVVSVAIPF